jgi:hypothetical protein
MASSSHLDSATPRCFSACVIFYGLATWDAQRVEDFFLTREEAEECLREVLADEPGWAGRMGIVRLDFGSMEPSIEVIA